MNGEGKLRTELTRTGIPNYEWPSLDGQVNPAAIYSAVSTATCYLYLCKTCLPEHALNKPFKRLWV